MNVLALKKGDCVYLFVYVSFKVEMLTHFSTKPITLNCDVTVKIKIQIIKKKNSGVGVLPFLFDLEMKVLS